MTKTAQLSVGVALAVVGVVVAITIPDEHFLIFTGRPFGIVVAIIGALDIVDALIRERQHKQ